MNGAGGIPTVQSFSFIYRMKVLTSGSSRVNDGDIAAFAITSGTFSAFISAGKGQTLMAVYRVPRGKKLLINSYRGVLGRNAPSNVRCNLELIAIVNATTNPTMNIKHSSGLFIDSGEGGAFFKYPQVFDEFTDINLRALDCTDNNTEITAWFDGELINA